MATRAADLEVTLYRRTEVERVATTMAATKDRVLS